MTDVRFSPWAPDSSLACRLPDGRVVANQVISDEWRIESAEIGGDGELLVVTFTPAPAGEGTDA